MKEPREVTVHGPQNAPQFIRVIVDGDHAGEPLQRCYTTGAFTMLGQQCLRGQSNWQSTVVLSWGESEYYAIVEAAAQGLHTAAVCRDLGLELGVQIAGKADMSVEVDSEEGRGKQKHLRTRLLWIQKQVEQGKIGIRYVGTRENEVDMTTKPLAANVMRIHLPSLGFEYTEEY
eukprot:3735417-Amphidinium_carterae.1